jgi:putative endonuclease
MEKIMTHYIYILKCSDGSLYTGYTTNVEERLKEHNGEGKKTGAKYTRGRRPVTLVHKERFKTRSNAMKREAAIKQLTRTEKELLISE